MFEKEIKFIVDYTLNKLRKEVAHVNMGRLLNSSIHPAIIKYCSAEIDNQIGEDRKKLLTNSFFDYSGREISRYFSLINEEIRKNYKMRSEDLKKLIIKAASFNANYVVRPGWTLAKFIFSDEKEKTIKEILNYFNYIYYYKYQIDVLSAFLSKKKITSLTQEEFVITAGKIDKEIIASSRKEILKDGITSIADFFNEGGMSREKVSPYLIEYYFKDKKFTEAANALKDIYPQENKQKRSIAEIIEKLSGILKENIEMPEIPEMPETPEPEVQQTMAPQADTVPELNEETEPPSEFDEFAEQAVTEKENLTEITPEETEKINEIEVSGQDKTDISVEDTSSKEIPEEKSPATNGLKFVDNLLNGSGRLNQRKEEKEKSKTETQEESSGFKFYTHEEEESEDVPVQSIGQYNFNKKGDIFSFLSKKEIDRIVESVFNDDQNEFAQTLDRLIGSKSYEDASGILKKVFQDYKINPYSKDAVMLTSAVANYFNQE